MVVKGLWIEAGLLMCWAVNVVQLCSTHVLNLFIWSQLYCNSCVDSQFVFPQDLQKKFDALSEEFRNYRNNFQLLEEKLQDAGGKIKALSCVTL